MAGGASSRSKGRGGGGQALASLRLSSMHSSRQRSRLFVTCDTALTTIQTSEPPDPPSPASSSEARCAIALHVWALETEVPPNLSTTYCR